MPIGTNNIYKLLNNNKIINKRKAEEAMTKLIAEYTENPEQFNKIEFVDYIRKWLKDKAKQVETVTIEGYEGYIKSHIIPYFEPLHLKLYNVSIKDIEGYYNCKANNGRLDGKPGGLSIASIRRHKTILNQIFQDALHNGLIKSNPCEYAKMPKIDKPSPKVGTIYTPEQCKKLLELTKGTILHDMIYITFIYGLRRSEMLGLKWDAIDFDNNTINICHTVVVQKTVTFKDRTKNKTSNRTYPLLAEIRDLLLERKRKQDEYKKIFGNCYIDTGYVFTKEDGNIYFPSYPSHCLDKTLKRYNLPHIRWHDLRHSCASALLLKGWQMKEISEWLGHSSINITMDIYSHINIEHKRELGNSLNGMLG